MLPVQIAIGILCVEKCDTSRLTPIQTIMENAHTIKKGRSRRIGYRAIAEFQLHRLDQLHVV